MSIRRFVVLSSSRRVGKTIFIYDSRKDIHTQSMLREDVVDKNIGYISVSTTKEKYRKNENSMD